VLRSMTPLWSLLRRPYLAAMRLAGSNSGIPVTVGSIRMRLHPDFATQNWETVEYASYRAFSDMLKEGDVVFDIGAHIGTYSLIASSRIGSTGRVYAYEPHAPTRRYLTQHLTWNGAASTVTIRAVCCGAQSGKATFYFMPGRAEGMNGLVPVDGFETAQVDVTTVDQEVQELGALPSVIKIDVEGAEWDVLKGAERLLSAHHPGLSLSIHPHALEKHGVRPQQILDWLRERGYSTEIIAVDHEMHVVARKA
jgi:FkbM family methyltransferase